MLFALDVPNAQALAFDNDPGVDGFKGFVLDQVMPDMGPVSLDHAGGVIGVAHRVHGGILAGIRTGRANPPEAESRLLWSVRCPGRSSIGPVGWDR